MKTGLILIDIQKDYFPGGKMEVEGAVAAGSAAARLLAVFRERGMPVIHVRHISERPGATFFLPGTEGTDFHRSVAPLPHEEVVEKHYPNSFRETGLKAYLDRHGIGQLVVCGMMSHMCIDATVRAAFDLGYSLTVAHDGCAARSLGFGGIDVAAESVHAAFMAALGAVYSRITSVEEVVSSLKT